MEILTGIGVNIVTKPILKLGKSIINHFQKASILDFFGESESVNNKIQIVYGLLHQEVNPKNPVVTAKKVRTNGKIDTKFRSDTSFTGKSSIQAVSYIALELASYSEYSISVFSDEDKHNVFDDSIICVDGPVTNELTALLLKDQSNMFFEFDVKAGSKSYSLKNKHLNRKTAQSVECKPEHDLGIIVRMQRPKTDSGKSVYSIVCAGLSHHGTVASAYYLSKNWRYLHKLFGKEDFGVLIETQINAPTSAKIKMHMSPEKGVTYV